MHNLRRPPRKARHELAGLTTKQTAFAYAIVAGMNATQAAREAGYKGSDNTLATVGAENMIKPAIGAALDAIRRDVGVSEGATPEYVVRRLMEIADGPDKAPNTIRALELIGRTLGMLDQRTTHTHTFEGTDKRLTAYSTDQLRALADRLDDVPALASGTDDGDGETVEGEFNDA